MKDLESEVNRGRKLVGGMMTRGRGIRKAYGCKNCPRKFRRKCSLLSHKIIHKSIALKGGGEAGGVGGKKVKAVPKPSSSSLILHWEYLCEMCGDKFVLKMDLERHQERLHKERTILCDVSGNWFSNEDSMVEHQVLVKTEPEWVCGECGEGFGGRLSLSVHGIKAHRKGGQRVRCIHCQKTFSRMDNMLRHVDKFHIMIPNPATSEVVNN
jgi:KRAB domain-containing zinc finger protein